MASGRKRKYGSVKNPSEDELNSVMMQNESETPGVDHLDDNNEDLDDNFHSEHEVRCYFLLFVYYT